MHKSQLVYNFFGPSPYLPPPHTRPCVSWRTGEQLATRCNKANKQRGRVKRISKRADSAPLWLSKRNLASASFLLPSAFPFFLSSSLIFFLFHLALFYRVLSSQTYLFFCYLCMHLFCFLIYWISCFYLSPSTLLNLVIPNFTMLPFLSSFASLTPCVPSFI